MQQYVCLLRAINVGGNNIIKMPALKDCLLNIGLLNIQTYLQSGNVIFQTESQDVEGLKKLIERQIQESFDLNIQTFLLKAEDWRVIADQIPFQGKDPRNIYITVLEQKTPSQGTEVLREKLLPEDEILLINGALYCYFPQGYGNTKLTLAFVEKKLGTYATTRNKNTVEKLKEMLIEA